MSLLPPELYREIATNLRAPTHRSELLSLSLVSKFWSNESQRILFRRFCHLGHTDTDEESERDRKVHIQFLRTILEHPQRLGRYVESYAQCGLACDRQSVSDARYSEADWKMEIYLWDLTKKALPAMVNLKHLVFDPALWRASASNSLLTGCSFQLEMISWGCDKDVLDLCSSFLPSQHNLLHLDIGRCPGGTTLLELPLYACPKLSSVLCNFQSMCHVTESRSIKALKMSKNHFGQNALQPLLRHSPALDRVQYLSLWNYALFRQ
ncbi:hypothetical protein D9619_000012 [Psilocybe cf. subviscida]|uniref:F-box domain-containing protein n=1 Tax=Psilocybe cf. subviscida TaxID=2480587 RepID=A0A8H5BDS8_9AGAR|nr:hypothetical protein D9619_000012 [Psilocybe cf. subviscida]